MTGSPAVQLETILAISKAMLEMAQTGRWDELIEQEHQRDGLIKTFNIPPIANLDTEQTKTQLNQLIELDKEIMSLCNEGKNAIGKALAALQHGREAVNAYARHAR